MACVPYRQKVALIHIGSAGHPGGIECSAQGARPMPGVDRVIRPTAPAAPIFESAADFGTPPLPKPLSSSAF